MKRSAEEKAAIRSGKLLGDRVTSVLNSLGADKVAKLIEKVGKRPCGCAGRRDALNRWHLRMLGAVDEMNENDGKDNQ